MGLNCKPFVQFLILTALILQSGRSTAQITPADTSDYLPMFYDGALEYNLLIAASMGYDNEVERLILRGADVNAETSEGATALIFAISGKMKQTVDILLKYNADVNKVTASHETPLLFATKLNNLEITESLIRNGAEINYQDQNGVTALNFASIYGYFYIADMLLYYRADPEIKANDGTTPLMAAVWAGYTDIADLLIQNGANMEARDNDGFTPFLIAAQNGDTLLLNLLIKKGIDLYERNKYNWDALNLAIRSGQKVAADMLIRKGEKWTNPERGALNPYSVAVKYDRDEIIDLLKKSNIPSEYKSGIDQMSVSLSSLFNQHDYYSGLSFSFKEPLLNAGFFTGFDTKLWWTRILIKQDDQLYYQYLDKSSMAYAGLFKEFRLTDNIFESNVSISTSLAAAYFFGNRFKGTGTRPEDKFKLIPEVDIKWSKKNFTIFSGIQFRNTDFHKVGPIWVRAGCSLNIFFDNVRAPGKIIKWY